jgi:cellulose synthase operon protein C
VVALQPRNAAAINNVAWLLATQRKPGAAAMAQRALELLPERAPLLDTLSLAQESESQLEKALETQQQAVKLDPRDPMLRLRLSRLLIQQGKKSDAKAQLETLAKLGAGFPAQAEVQDLLKNI